MDGVIDISSPVPSDNNERAIRYIHKYLQVELIPSDKELQEKITELLKTFDLTSVREIQH